MRARHFDIAVIGAGSGGLSAAAAAAQFGCRVVLFEAGDMGGDCLNTGCVPSKALIAAARQAQAMRTAARFGITPVAPTVDFAAVRAHVQRTIATLAPHDSQQRFEALGVSVIRAAAHFVNDRTVEARGEHYTARRFIIATGSRPAIPPIPGLAEVPYLTNETLFASETLPSHLLVIGGGAIGLEMAQAHRRLGSEVTVIEAAAPLAQDDPELAAVVLGHLAREGVGIITSAAVSRVSSSGGGITLEVGGRSITGSHLLVATGRRPNIEKLGLEAAGIAVTPRGITVDRGLRTSNRRAYAIGDVAGGRFTHEAGYQAGIVIRSALFGLPARATAAIPHVTYTDPELAQVGLTERQARAAHGDGVRVLRAPFSGNDRAVTEAEVEGLVKVITTRRGRILGAGIAGAGAGDLIQPWVLALQGRLKISALASSVLPYPTRGEASRRAAIGYFAGLASNRLLRHVMGLVSRIIP
ncbi:dihydrolipoamide dehydrogenase [Aestuariivirga litoralis]|uniref:Dihydrolipoamide dehydrogenase n=1 Tax=Aestuariivirga litoralis TaxID=2650924 RepID=A0A2W2BKI4_9HYPH|nr:FAD-dependent oxidoreductase [Aestuariivirga litoralis]PZF76729.1 dihydrolipoamide dehydrogenase [Aestuariivirga litoralis]